MPPRTKTTKLTKAKENVVTQNKCKNVVVSTKRQRKPLADKTNSASDDNESIEVKGKGISGVKAATKENMRPRRDRRLPTRFVNNNLLANLSNSSNKDVSPSKIKEKPDKSRKVTKTVKKAGVNTSKSAIRVIDENESPENKFDSSLVVNRPKRIHRLPAKFEEHLISPVKYNHVPCHASTPIVPNTKLCHDNDKPKTRSTRKITQKTPVKTPIKIIPINKTGHVQDKKVLSKRQPIRTQIKSSVNIPTSNIERFVTKSTVQIPIKAKADKNNNPNAKQKEALQKSVSEENIKHKIGKVVTYNKNFSYRILEENSPKAVEEKLAVYDFTFDPNEEPAPQKKKRKRTIRKKTVPKPKTFFTDNYNKNLNKTLTCLKSIMTKKNGSDNDVAKPNQVVHFAANPKPLTENHLKIHPLPNQPLRTQPLNTQPETSQIQTSLPDTHPLQTQCGVLETQSFETQPQESPPREDHDSFVDDINYSPVTSPAAHRAVKISTVNETRDLGRVTLTRNTQGFIKNTPLQEELSFFDDQPVASSSMNTTRNPMASPWRVDFDNLPIRWGPNVNIKPNMTPAVESSFINPENTKKHVYTNILSDNVPDINTNTEDNSKLKQSSLLSFFKEVCEKKQKKKSVTPTKNNSLFNDSFATNSSKTNVTPEGNSHDNITDRITRSNTKTPIKRRNSNIIEEIPTKTRKEVPATVENCFGFDDSSIADQENISPKNKDIPKRTKSRTNILKEVNKKVGPYRANIPLATEIELKTQIIEEKQRLKPNEATREDFNVEMNLSSDSYESEAEEQREMVKEDSPIPLFEDIEVLHHSKPIRKSYGKAKKVAFHQPSVSETRQLDDSDNDAADHTFQLPVIKVKKQSKKKPKPKRSRKEEKEAEEWAAGFNSMCEEVDEFDLVVE